MFFFVSFVSIYERFLIYQELLQLKELPDYYSQTLILNKRSGHITEHFTLLENNPVQ